MKCIHKKRFYIWSSLKDVRPHGSHESRIYDVSAYRTHIWRRHDEKMKKKNVDSAAIFKGFTISTVNFILDFSIDWRKNSINHSFAHPTHTIKVNLKYSQITVNYRRHDISQWLQFIGNFKNENIFSLLVLFWLGNAYALAWIAELRLDWLTV